MALQKKVGEGLYLDSVAWCYCNKDEEYADHILANCLFARIVMEWTFKWCGIGANQFTIVVEVLDFAAE